MNIGFFFPCFPTTGILAFSVLFTLGDTTCSQRDSLSGDRFSSSRANVKPMVFVIVAEIDCSAGAEKEFEIGADPASEVRRAISVIFGS